ncbi:MAG: hypothetical protein Q4G71_07495 [Pseudomonadota bacterium]|nr:hypothetical protein [Pseudomonadota bacterium]
MIYTKTHQGRAALQERQALSLRERQLMVLCNGVRSRDELIDLFGNTVSHDIDQLERKGFLVAQRRNSRPAPLQATPDDTADSSDSDSDDVPSSFVSSRLPVDQTPPPDLAELPRMSLQELTALADVPPVRPAVTSGQPGTTARRTPAPDEAPARRAAMVNSVDAEQMPVRSPVAAQAYMTQVLMALNHPEATTLIESHGSVRHDVDIVLYLAQGIGLTHRVAGEDATLRVALRTGRLMPAAEVPMLLDCTLDYVPAEFSVLLYEFVLAGRETGL